MTIKPIGNQILIEPIEAKNVLVSQQKSLCEYGKVIAVGPDVKAISPGETIGFTVWGLNHLEVDGKKYYFVQEDDRFLLGKIEA